MSVFAEYRDSIPDTFMETFRGHAVNPFDVDPETLDLRDIAKSLSCICRYNGHTEEFYSVAEHSCLMAQHALDETGDFDFAWACLLHDAAEAYVGDMIQPIKRFLPDFSSLIETVEAAIYDTFCVDMLKYRDRVKEYDLRMLLTERKALMPDTGRDWDLPPGLEPLPVKIEAHLPRTAHAQFLLQLVQIQKGMGQSD